MINIQTLVDSAIEANLTDYKRLVTKYNRYSHWAEEATNEADEKSYQLTAWSHLGEFGQIKETLVRIFPDYAEYINDKLVTARIELDK